MDDQETWYTKDLQEHIEKLRAEARRDYESLRLTIDVIPRDTMRVTLCELCPPGLWRMIRKKVFSLYGEKCCLCGYLGKRIHCHEVWELDFDRHVQILKGIWPLCGFCHEVKHFGAVAYREKAKGKDARKAKVEKMQAHFVEVNKCAPEVFDRHILTILSLRHYISDQPGIRWTLALLTQEQLEEWVKDVRQRKKKKYKKAPRLILLGKKQRESAIKVSRLFELVCARIDHALFDVGITDKINHKTYWNFGLKLKRYRKLTQEYRKIGKPDIEGLDDLAREIVNFVREQARSGKIPEDKIPSSLASIEENQ